MTRLALLIATAGGAGWAPLAPGTVGSGLTALGIWAADRAEQALGRKDPGAIVIDEVAGMTLAVLPFPPTWPVLATGFVLFRIFDIWKPFPANDAQRLPGGLGVMADDLVAGLYALLVVAALRAGLEW